MLKPTLEQAKKITGYSVIPVCREILSDFTTPIEVLKKLRRASRHVYILESVENQEKWGRYTFLGYNPKLEITCINGELTVKDVLTGTVETSKQSHPADYIKKLMAGYSSPALEGFPSFTGGLVGYFSYDYIKYSEPTLNLDAKDEEHFKDVDLMLFDKVIAFDNIHQKIMLITNISSENIDSEYANAEKELAEMEQLIRFGKPADIPHGKLTSEFRKLFDKEHYCDMVEKAKHYIYEGDIFQVVLSNRLDADFEGSLFDAYRVLRATNPSPYMFFFSGTRPRGATDEEDKALEVELLHDEKELSEHNMLVDLGRNDIGKISKFGSVEVEKYMCIERYSHVMHIGSTVRGEILDSKSALDAVDAILPAGTLSGAPKLRACEIINELENNKRGVYGGAVGYIDFRGNLDTCIAIRLAFRKNGRVFVRSGAGIVADSVPENEFNECINKAKAVMNALTIAQEENL